ncbi:AT-hook motif nuclear-localized protein 8-like [Senna tora]|uniref:AT-hook motif nuclear-localized protein n=1 Tax=Senna tora TaxID=362788 RepID=A0A834W6C4_9FABA|nr:AT-hook motif nuclear-localized protein 8-like [Senna tora]
MDSREPPQPPPPSQQLQSMAQQQPQSAAPNMMMGHTSYASVMPNPNTSSMIGANSNAATAMMAPTTARFPFNAGVPQPSAPSKPLEHLNNNSSPYDGSSSAMRPCGFNIDAAKKKRGRPRKYSPDGNIALGLAPTPMSSSAGQGDSNGTPSTDPASKKHRGRPPGSGKKQMDALGSAGVGFTPHVILVKAGEDIAAKIMAFSQQGPRTVCILSANGAIGNVSLRQAATSGGTVQYEGRFEIISLSGSFLPYDDNSGRSRAGGLSVSLAGSDGKVLGGGVAGMLIAASPVQVIVGSFIADGKKSSSNILKSGAASSGPASQMLNFGGPMTPTSPTSQGPSSESSDDNDNNSAFNRGPGLYNNASQPIHNMQMYHPQLWAGQSQP